jgi:hypothetical protein
MHIVGRPLTLAVILFLAASTSPPAKAAATLRIAVTPAQINVGRDVVLTVTVRSSAGELIPVQVHVIGTGTTVGGTAAHGTIVLTVHATTLGKAAVQAASPGFPPASLSIPIVPGPPASVVSFVHGVDILPPNAPGRSGTVGSDLFQDYRASTAEDQLASIGLRDGTLIDLNSNSEVQIRDPLHTSMSGGDLFWAVVHGSVSHTVQAGTAVVATKGTRFDIRYAQRSRTVVVTVIQGSMLVTNGNNSVIVPAGMQTTVVGALPPTAPKTVNVQAQVRWVLKLPNSNAALIATPVLAAASTGPASPTAEPTLAPSPTSLAYPTVIPSATPG